MIVLFVLLRTKVTPGTFWSYHLYCSME